jgi:hypothetical protein
LCGFARRLREAKSKEKKDPGKKDGPKRHYKCDKSPQECDDFHCHFHPGRATVLPADLELSALPNMTGKDCETAIKLYNDMIDFAVEQAEFEKVAESVEFDIESDTCSEYSTESVPDNYQRYIEGNHITLPCSTDDSLLTSPDEASDSDSSLSDEFESKHDGPIVSPEQLKISAQEKMTDLIDLIDEQSSNPREEEKKPASEIVGPIVVSHGERQELLDDPTVERVMIFEQYEIDSPEHGPRLKDKMMYRMRKFGRAVGVLRTEPVIKHNANDGYVLSNIFVKERASMCLNRWFFQTWKKATEEGMEDCIDLLNGAFTHATEVDVYATLAEYFLTHRIFAQTNSSLLDGNQLRKTVLLRYDKMLSEHHDFGRFTDQILLEHTKTFVCNQLLIRGLIDRSRQPTALQPVRTEVLFHRGARSKMPERRALHSASRRKIAPLSRSSGTMVLSTS